MSPKTNTEKSETAKKPAAKKATAKKAVPKKSAAAKKPAAKKTPAKKAVAKKPEGATAEKKVAVAKRPRLSPVLRAVKKALTDKKGADIAILDVRTLTSVADTLVLCTGLNMPHLAALSDSVIAALRKLEPPVAPHRRAGARESEWVVLDYVDVVVHLFTPEMRKYYALEQLWKDAPRM